MKGLYVIFVLFLLIGAAIAYTSAPCSLWNWAPASDIPGRCIMVENR